MTPEAQLAMIKAERDGHKKDAANLSTIITRLEADCVTLRDQSYDIAEERDRLRVALKDALDRAEAAPRVLVPAEHLATDRWLPELNRAERERTQAQTRAEAAEARAENAETELAIAFARLDAAVAAELRQRDLDARVMVDAEVRKLREQLNAMTDARDAANDRAAMMERDAAESRAKLDTLLTMFRAAISALVRG